MNHELALRHCRIVAPEQLSDRFISSGAFFQQDSPDLHSQVFLAYVFEITQSWFPSSQVLPTLLKTLQAYHPTLKPGPKLGDQFEQLLKQVNEELNTISEGGETDWIGNLNGLILVMSGTELHFSQTGRCPAYLLQKNRIRQITDDGGLDREPHPLKTFFNIASGVVGFGDYILVSNLELYNEISLDALRRVMHGSTPAEACLAIVKELKREKNLGVSSLILQLATTKEIEENPEVTEVILEEEMQSAFKKLKKRLTPLAVATADTSRKLGKASFNAAKVATVATHRTVTPAAKSLLQKSASAAKKHSSRPPAVEIIHPTGKKNEPDPQPSQGPQPVKPLQPVRHFRTPSLPSLPRIQGLGNLFQNKKVVALSIAALLVLITGISAYVRHHPNTQTTSLSQHDESLQKAEDLQNKAEKAVELKQYVEASREIKEAKTIINQLSDLNEAQKKRAHTIWNQLATTTAAFIPTTALEKTVATYDFNGPVQHFISNLPYFYGFTNASPLLQRSGKGESGTVQDSLSLPDADDSIIAFTESLESDTAGYVLSRNNQVYRLTQDGTATNLRAISPASGDFAPGDAISTYNNNVYILDGKTGLLWRYATSGTVYEKGESIIDSTKYDIKKSLSLAIDGSIYILKQDGSVLKFTSGQQENFALKEQPELLKDLLQPLQIITNEDMDNLYLLDGGVSSGSFATARILEFNKNGTFVRQYTFPDSLSQILSFDIDPKAKKIWVLSDNTISEFNF